MYIRATPEQLAASTDLQSIAMFALMNGCSADWEQGRTSYYFDRVGELLATKDHLTLCYTVGAEVDKARLFAVLPDSLMDNLVDVDLPWPKEENDPETGEVGVYGERRIYSEYFKWKWQLEDGTWLVKLVPRPYGRDSGNGLSNEQFRAFWEWNSAVIISTAEGKALIPTGDEA